MTPLPRQAPAAGLLPATAATVACTGDAAGAEAPHVRHVFRAKGILVDARRSITFRTSVESTSNAMEGRASTDARNQRDGSAAPNRLLELVDLRPAEPLGSTEEVNEPAAARAARPGSSAARST